MPQETVLLHSAPERGLSQAKCNHRIPNKADSRRKAVLVLKPHVKTMAASVVCCLLAGCFNHGLLLNDRSNVDDVNLTKEGAVCFWIASEKTGFYELEVEHVDTGDNWRIDMNPLVDQTDAVPMRRSALDRSGGGKDALQTSYLVYQLPKGTYEMAYFRHRVGDWKTSLLLKPSRFTIRPGEITYIGTYEFQESVEKGVLFDKPAMSKEVGLKDFYDGVREYLATVEYLGINKLPVRKELARLELQHPLEKVLGAAPSPADDRRVARQARPIGP